ncbi:MAG: carbon-nitrogen hydrolase family protein [Leptospiraceae bacterium]|nr:carbon-nitrogen hydrolase family protein [Leptospiraceae bacterium]
MKIAVLQLNSGDNFKKNLASIVQMIDRAAQNEAELIVLPENFLFFGAEEIKLTQADQIEKTLNETFTNISVQHKLHILAGGYPSLVKNKVYNRAKLFSNTGIEWQYDKIHLFDILNIDTVKYQESKSTMAGTIVPEPFILKNLKVNAAICYDLRFPELFREMSRDKNLDVLIITAAFTYETGKAHWETLLKARAIENQCYVIAAAQCGQHPLGRKTWGHSMVIDPWGNIVAEAAQEIGIIYADLSLAQVQEVRTSFPALEHRKIFDQ